MNLVEKEMRFVDTHCHLENEEFDKDRDAVIHQAEALGVDIISSAICLIHGGEH
jgi:Tat protein secretion system quality control protein TatD with DNase activity